MENQHMETTTEDIWESNKSWRCSATSACAILAWAAERVAISNEASLSWIFFL
jgi:anti-sigma-K factor RskA